MASTPPDYSRWQNEPSIVIDPGLYAAPRPRMGRRVLGTSLAVLRTLACVGVLGVTVFAIAHADKWLASGHGDVHASERGAAPMLLAVESPPVVVESLQFEMTDSTGIDLDMPQAAPQPAPTPILDDHAASTEKLHEALRKGRRLLNQRRLDEADAAYAEVLDARARHPGALAGRARVQLARGELDRALELAELSVRSAPAHALYHVTLADVLRARGEPAAADVELATAERLSHKPVDRAEKLLPDNPF